LCRLLTGEREKKNTVQGEKKGHLCSSKKKTTNGRCGGSGSEATPCGLREEKGNGFHDRGESSSRGEKKASLSVGGTRGHKITSQTFIPFLFKRLLLEDLLGFLEKREQKYKNTLKSWGEKKKKKIAEKKKKKTKKKKPLPPASKKKISRSGLRQKDTSLGFWGGGRGMEKNRMAY